MVTVDPFGRVPLLGCCWNTLPTVALAGPAAGWTWTLKPAPFRIDVAVACGRLADERVFNASARRGAHLRKIAGVILRNIFVQGPQRRALLIDVGIVEITLRERATDRLRSHA